MAQQPNYAAAARQQAQEILSHAPYSARQATTRRPLAGLLHAIGRGLEIVFGPIFRWIGDHIFRLAGSGLSYFFGGWALFVGIVLAVAMGVLLALVLVRRRSRIATRPSDQQSVEILANPDDLEAEADDLAARGAFAAAVRLRFEAGLLRLERAGLIADQRTSTGAELVNRIGSPTFDGLALRHEEVAYAGQPADEDDVRVARLGWLRVPDEARTSRKTTEASSR
jgi:hypothetical protein